MDTTLLIGDLNRVYGWELTVTGRGGSRPEDASEEESGSLAENELESQLAEKINILIQRDFGTLVQLLYRIDVSEKRLRGMLDSDTGEDAGRVIARLIMERQWQKIESRRRFRQDDAGQDNDTGVERW
jgi:hypothetical protein